MDLARGTFAAAAAWHRPSLLFLLGQLSIPSGSPSPSPSHTGCPEPGLEQKMVYFRMMPLGLAGGNQDTTTLLAEDGTALMPAGGPGTEGGRAWQSRRREVSEVSAQLGEAAAPRCRAGIPRTRWGGAARAFPCQHQAGTNGDGSVGERSARHHPTAHGTPLHGWLQSPADLEAGGLIAAQALVKKP